MALFVEKGLETYSKNRVKMDASVISNTLKNRKILVLQKMGHIGGAEKNLESWLDEFIEKYQFNVSILGPGEGPFFDRMNDRGFHCFKTQLPDWRKGKNLFSRYVAQRNMLKILKKERFDLIFVNDFFYAPYGVYLSRHKKTPLIVHVQSDIEKKRVNQYQLHSLDALIVTTHSTFDKVEPFFKEKERAKLKIIPPGVSEKKQNLLSQKPVPRGKIVFGIAANILPHKGIQFFLNLLNELKDQGGWEIHWVGRDVQNLLDGLRQKINEMQLQDRVFFHGFVEDMSSFYSSIDCLIHPSQFEPFGMVMVEAMSYGIPVISTQTAGGVEILGDVDGGRWLVPLNGHKEMANIMMEMIINPERCLQVSLPFFEKYSSNYRKEISMKKMEECFCEVLLQSRMGTAFT